VAFAAAAAALEFCAAASDGERVGACVPSADLVVRFSGSGWLGVSEVLPGIVTMDSRVWMARMTGGQVCMRTCARTRDVKLMWRRTLCVRECVCVCVRERV